MKLFERFDKVYCINLKRRPDRLQHFIEQVNKYDLGNFEVFEAVDGNELTETHPFLRKGELGHLNTTIKILENSIKNNYQNVLLIEDDCVFNSNINQIDTYFSYLPSDWDMLYFGGNHNIHVSQVRPQVINDKIIKLYNTYTSHCIGITNKMFEIILNSLKNKDRQTDVIYQSLQQNYNVYCFEPLVATQLSGFSDIQNVNVDYSWLIQ